MSEQQLPWEKAADQIHGFVDVPREVAEHAIKDACFEFAAQQTADLRDENQKLAEEIKWRTEHMAASDHEICQMEDWLCGNAEFDKNGLIDKANRCKERIRDLIAAEGEVGDLRDERDRLNALLRVQVGFKLQAIAERDTLAATVVRLREALTPLLKEVTDMRDGLLPKQHILPPSNEGVLLWEGYSPSEARGEPELAAKWTALIELVTKALAATPPPAVVPANLHKTVSRNWQEELEHDNAVLRDVLTKIAEGNHVGTSIKKNSAVMMMIEKALEDTSSVAVVPLQEVNRLVNALQEIIYLSGEPHQRRTIAENALATFRAAHPQATPKEPQP